MSAKTIGVVLLCLLEAAAVAAVTYQTATLRYSSEIARLKGEVGILKTQVENYAHVIRVIRETATQMGAVEKAQP